MKSGRTIVAEREQLESASERMHAREKLRRKKQLSVVAVVLILVIVVIVGIVAWKTWVTIEPVAVVTTEKIEPKAEIIDEAKVGVPTRVREYAAYLEQDLNDLGYTVIRVVLPQDKRRELYVDLDGHKGYFKVNIDRGSGETAEDIDRMIKYLGDKEVEYVDVKVEGKAFYK